MSQSMLLQVSMPSKSIDVVTQNYNTNGESQMSTITRIRSQLTLALLVGTPAACFLSFSFVRLDRKREKKPTDRTKFPFLTQSESSLFPLQNENEMRVK